MMRNGKWLGLNLVLVGALAAPVSAGQEPIQNDRDTLVRQELSELRKSLDALTKAIEKLQSANVNTSLQINKTQSDIDGLQRQLAQLQRDLEELRRAATPPRASFYGPAPTTPTGQVRIVNSYLAPITVIVNGKAYTVNPGGQRMTDPVPAGVFTYEVLGVQSTRDRLLSANETFTITIHP